MKMLVSYKLMGENLFTIIIYCSKQEYEKC